MYYLHVKDDGDEHSSGLIINVIATTSHTRYKQIITSSSTKKLIT
jgi:hypothetical protein